MMPSITGSQPDYRWFASDGFYIAIDQTRNSSAENKTSNVVDYAPVSDLRDAILLAEYELLLQCLDDWTGMASEWRPVRAVPGPESEVSSVLHELEHLPRITLALRSLDSDGRQLFVCVPVADLKDMPDLPAQWRSVVEIERFITEVQIGIQSWPSSDTEQQSLVPGAMILLRDSYEERWPVSVHSGETSNKWQPSSGFEHTQVLLDPDSASIRLLSAADKPSTHRHPAFDKHSVSVRLQQSVSFNSLYAQSIWQAGGAMVLPLPDPIEGARVSVVMRTVDDQPGSADLPGSIVRLGSGLAVLLDN